MSESLGIIRMEVRGEGLTQLNNEPGGHRLQRIPPTERKGRVHSSSVTVAVFHDDQFTKPDYDTIDPKDLKVEWYSGTGAGGQHRNKHQNSIRLTHIPTGITETSQCRSREASQREATTNLVARLKGNASHQLMVEQSIERKAQTGSGMRGDKVRTYRFQDNIATDHRNGKKVSLSKIMEGNFDLLW